MKNGRNGMVFIFNNEFSGIFVTLISFAYDSAEKIKIGIKFKFKFKGVWNSNDKKVWNLKKNKLNPVMTFSFHTSRVKPKYVASFR